jgi:uncharacterized membrane protein
MYDPPVDDCCDIDGLGTIELLAIKFPGTRFTGPIIDALNELVDRGTIRIVDAVFANRTETGEVRVLELGDLDQDSFAALEPLVEDILGVLSEDDVRRMGAVLKNGSSAGLMLVENTWTTRFNAAIACADGELLAARGVPRNVLGEIVGLQRAITPN